MNDDGTLTPARRRAKAREGVLTPETVDPKIQNQRLLVMYNSIFEYKVFCFVRCLF